MKGALLLDELKEPLISKAIVDSYHRKLLRSIESDVVIVGAGPAGLTALRAPPTGSPSFLQRPQIVRDPMDVFIRQDAFIPCAANRGSCGEGMRHPQTRPYSRG